jgi:hypothetical protein
MSSILCIQVQVQADSQANELGHLHTDQVDRGVDSFHHLAPPSSLSFVRSHNTSIIPRLPGRILQLSARSPCYTIGSFVSCSSHFPGPGPGPVRILMLCGTVHAFNNIHPNATIQPSATCLATSQRVVIHQQMIGYSYKEEITTPLDQPGPSRPDVHPSSAPATIPPTFHKSCISLGTCGRGVPPWPSCARQTPT